MDGRLKRLHHKCKYMGMHENDVIFARFAKRYLDDLPEEEIVQFETLLEQNDVDIFKWITEKQPVPAGFENEVMQKLRQCQEYAMVEGYMPNLS
ncbi:succinate dehydrogenase assembly factor 2 [Terasakiella sp. SH-1]|uniref:succinate dehydrogenase assembly factor 2 n=1 Tax=Terasakiella sp. SH-1 TaxID=2560057 RepID=UPI0010746428|nr:succinate dehydrogenase assembly factor 2 [Terasakiella sp. SH-1]